MSAEVAILLLVLAAILLPAARWAANYKPTKRIGLNKPTRMQALQQRREKERKNVGP